MKKLMHFLAKIFPGNKAGENPFAVKMFHRMTKVKEFFRKENGSTDAQWPPYPGSYKVVNPKGNIAVCTLTTENFFSKDLSSLNVAITGTVMTPNLGIEKIILNTISNPNIRCLLLCGKESPVFKVGQAFECLFRYGVDNDKRIIHAEGHFPVLSNLPLEKIFHFLRQVEFVNLIGEKDEDTVLQSVNQVEISRPQPVDLEWNVMTHSEETAFTELKPGGKRTPLDYDQKGFFVITVDNTKKEITVKHYYKNNRPGFIIKGHSSEAILLAILNENLVSQMSHAGYLGAELSKAEIALKLNLQYTQDQPVRSK
jgi:tetrahydromethanopterin S-methyltransferase subunit A